MNVAMFSRYRLFIYTQNSRLRPSTALVLFANPFVHQIIFVHEYFDTDFPHTRDAVTWLSRDTCTACT